MACTKHGHEALIEVYRHAGAASDAVTRWCGSCGSVVVDEDYDGRVNPGTYFAMRTPNSTVERDALKAQLVARDAEIGRLRAALAFQDPRNATARYDRIADEFYAETGMWPPGRSRAPEMGSDPHPPDEVHRAWRDFCNKWHERWFDQALAPVAEEPK